MIAAVLGIGIRLVAAEGQCRRFDSTGRQRDYRDAKREKVNSHLLSTLHARPGFSTKAPDFCFR
jgi:hypothetical protein